MQEFEVKGPFEIKPKKLSKGLLINNECLNEFWESLKEIRTNRGIYIFGMRVSKGYVPWYVGQTKRNFEKECSDKLKVNIYNEIMIAKRGTPIMFFLVQKINKGPQNNSILNHVEKYFINIAISKNPDLYNKKGTKKPEWSVKGVLNTSRGRWTKESKEFKKFIGLQ
jgi:hypothetical protein